MQAQLEQFKKIVSLQDNGVAANQFSHQNANHDQARRTRISFRRVLTPVT